MTSRTFVVLRHAEAASGIGVADTDRPLTERGIRDAQRVGHALAELGCVPDLVLCSPARRARQTWLQLDGNLGGSRAGARPVRHERAIYSGGADDLLDLVRETEEDTATLLLIGHNPTLHRLVWTLVPDGAVNGFPAGCFAAIDVADGWRAVGPAAGTLLRFWAP